MRAHFLTKLFLSNLACIYALNSYSPNSKAHEVKDAVGDSRRFLFPVSPLATRDDSRQKCSLPLLLNLHGTASTQNGDSPSIKLEQHFPDNHGNYSIADGLVRRTMPMPQPRIRDMWKYYKTQLVDTQFTPIVFDVRRGQSDFNSAVEIDIGGPTAQTLAIDRVCGCTTLIVASRTGAYGAHYWESLSFATDAKWLVPEGPYIDQEDAFQKTVIQGLRNGVQGEGSANFPGKPEQVSLTSVAAKIMAGAGPSPATDNKIKGYLFFPSESWNEKQTPYADYQEKFNRIKTTVGEIIPALHFDPTAAVPNPLWTELPYNVVRDLDILGGVWNGVMMFKYDPDHHGKKKAALWAENDSTDRHNDEWV